MLCGDFFITLTAEVSVIFRKITAALTVIALILALLVSCGGGNGTGDTSGTGSGSGAGDGGDIPTALNVYDMRGDGYGIFFAGEEAVMLSDGRECKPGELKPVWREISEMLQIPFARAETVEDADIVIGEIADLTVLAGQGKLLDLSMNMSSMPNLRGYLSANADARLGFLSGGYGESYVLPTYDYGFLPTRLPMIRADLVSLLLDGEGMLEAEGTGVLTDFYCMPVMPTSGVYEVDILSESGLGATAILKNVSRSGNILEIMNFAISYGALSGVDAVNMLRTYIDEAYDGFYGERRSDLYIGERAAWDADELVALLRCIRACADILGISEGECGIASLSGGADIVSLASLLCGVKGLDSSDSLFYVTSDGELVDARYTDGADAVLRFVHRLICEGLIADEGEVGALVYGMSEDACYRGGVAYTAMNVPVSQITVRYTDRITRYCESMYIAHGASMAVSRAVAEDEEKMAWAASLIDYLYSAEGEKVMRHGASEYDISRLMADAELLTDGSLERLMREYVGAQTVMTPENESVLMRSPKIAERMKEVSVLLANGRILTPTVLPDGEYISVALPDTWVLTEAEAALMLQNAPECAVGGGFSGDSARRVLYGIALGAKEASDITRALGLLDNQYGSQTHAEMLLNAWIRHEAYYRLIFK